MQRNILVININKKYYLRFGKRVFKCQIGASGLKKSTQKVEGDKTTPIGKWYLISLYYRSDKILRPKIKKKSLVRFNIITKNCGWCDDIKSHHYNKYIKINNIGSMKINYEDLWREDDVYDIIIVLSHNIKPTIKNKGSAIFIHCSHSDNKNTDGCIALKKKDLIYLLKNVNDKTSIKILI